MTLRDDIDRYAEEGGWITSIHLVDKISAGLERNKIIISRADLPEVTVYGSDYVECDNETTYYGEPEKLRRDARRSLALADHFEARNNEAAVLEARRDQVTREHSPAWHANIYGELCEPEKAIVDRIIELQDGAAS